MKVVVCDYGAGNVRSVVAAFARLAVRARPTREPEDVLEADLAVLPGVGSARSAMNSLRTSGLDEALRDRVLAGGSTLGICLGLQIALDESEEDGGVAGLGLVPGAARRLEEGRVPRIGWAQVEPSSAAKGPGLAPQKSARADFCIAHCYDEAFYFAHSYVADTPAATAHSEGLVAVAAAGSFVGVQFHPEKSGAAGARFLAGCLSPA